MKRSALVFCGVLSAIHVAYGELVATKFPGTIEDLSFESRMENIADGYKPFLDKKAYQELNIVPGEEIYTDHLIATIEQQENDALTMDITEYCAKHPDDTTRCPPSTPPPPSQPIQAPPPGMYYSGYTIGGGAVIENNSVTGGSCYPADHDDHFVNKILTTGKYENIYPALEKGLITVFRKEGGCGTIKNDPCGYTCYGIGSSPKCTGIVVHSRAEAEEVYYDRYWKKYNLDKLPDVISTDIFLAGMASGPTTALLQFREFLGLSKKPAVVNDDMINAVKNYSGDIHNDWLDKRDVFLQNVARKRYNGSVSRGYKNAIEIKRKNGCHVRPKKPLYRQ